jgi:ubiquitin
MELHHRPRKREVILAPMLSVNAGGKAMKLTDRASDCRRAQSERKKHSEQSRYENDSRRPNGTPPDSTYR